MLSDIEIANAADAAPDHRGGRRRRSGSPSEHLVPYGHHKAKVDLALPRRRWPTGRSGELVLMTALSPTPAGEGKTTTTVGLTDALHGLGHRAVACLREPSMGPVFGMKGGAAGGGYSQVVPMADINLHFTGDFAAIAAAQQPARRADRQPRAPRQRARHRRPQRHLEAGASTSTTARCARSSSGSAASPTASRARTASTSSSPPS